MEVPSRIPDGWGGGLLMALSSSDTVAYLVLLPADNTAVFITRIKSVIRQSSAAVHEQLKKAKRTWNQDKF